MYEGENAFHVVSSNGMGADNRHFKAQTLAISVYQAWASEDARVQGYAA